MFIDRLIDEGGDWDRRNRLKVYRGTYCMAVRDFKLAASLFLDTVATFTSYELMDYKTFVTYTVFCSMIALSRPDLREKVSLVSSLLQYVITVNSTSYRYVLKQSSTRDMTELSKLRIRRMRISSYKFVRMRICRPVVMFIAY